MNKATEELRAFLSDLPMQHMDWERVVGWLDEIEAASPPSEAGQGGARYVGWQVAEWQYQAEGSNRWYRIDADEVAMMERSGRPVRATYIRYDEAAQPKPEPTDHIENNRSIPALIAGLRNDCYYEAADALERLSRELAEARAAKGIAKE